MDPQKCMSIKMLLDSHKDLLIIDDLLATGGTALSFN